jgi:Heterokaryon incompatibility protein (HET)
MLRCNTCHDLQENLGSEVAPTPSIPTPGGRLSFEIEVPILQWRNSAEGGCVTCQLIWDIIVHFGREFALVLSQPGSEMGVNVWLEGRSGLPLLLGLDELPEDKHFPNLEVYTTSPFSSSFSVLGQAADVSEDLELLHCVRLTQNWITQCSNDHVNCRVQGSGTLPTRVLDLTPDQVGVAVRLHVSEPGQMAQYVALSYCWGSVGNLKTTLSTLEKWKAGIPWELFSRSFRDAIAITKGLGVQYLWIDSLCIVQNDTADWEREAGRMAQVYENAYITIATDAAKDPTCGILIARRKERERRSNTDEHKPERCNQIARFSVPDGHGSVMQVHAREYLQHFELINTIPVWDVTYPLLSRAWTLQERLLPCRTLHFTAYELIWECRTTLLCECATIHREFCGQDWRGPKIAYARAMAQVLREMDLTLKNPGDEPRSRLLSSTWTRLISGYSCRQLTYVSNKLVAISGIAGKFASLNTDSRKRTYLAGLWEEDLPWLLCWRAFNRRYDHRVAVYCAPTWSWASITSPVIWDTVTFDATSKVKVIEVATTIAGSRQNKLGRVQSGHITLQGLVQSATIDCCGSHSAVLGLRNRRGERIVFIPDQNSAKMASESSDAKREKEDKPCSPVISQRTASSLQPGETISCLFLLHDTAKDDIYALVLASPAVAEGSQKRIGPVASPPHQHKVEILERIGIITQMSYQYEKNEVAVST